MKKVAVITDSNSGITQKQAAEFGIQVVPMPFFVDGTTYYEDISMNQKEFYEYLSQEAEVMTSQPSPEDLMELWNTTLQEYDEIVYIPMSSGLSSSCGTAMMLSYEEEFKDKVFVVDNQRISVTQRQSVLDAMALAEKGFGGADIRDILLREKFESSIYIMVDTLSYLKKGGRVTPAAAAIGTVLRIKPVLQIQGEKLDAYAKVKTLKQAKTTMIKAIRRDFEERFHDPDGDNFHMAIAYTAGDEEALRFKEELKQEFPGHDIWVDPLSLSVSCHIGPGALALAISKKVEECSN
ncbi:MAG: DegV family protein [Lachnospiraceae bacterium]|nr:DegV family protein [Lachnospiraceae bacterium]